MEQITVGKTHDPLKDRPAEGELVIILDISRELNVANYKRGLYRAGLMTWSSAEILSWARIGLAERPAFVLDNNDPDCLDFALQEPSGWVRVGELSIWIQQLEDAVGIEVFRLGEEDKNNPLSRMTVFEDDEPATQAEYHCPKCKDTQPIYLEVICDSVSLVPSVSPQGGMEFSKYEVGETYDEIWRCSECNHEITALQSLDSDEVLELIKEQENNDVLD